MGATTIIGYRGTRQEADDVDALARSCGCTRAAYMRYAGRYLAAAVRLEVIAREEIRRGNLTSEQVDLRDRAEANQAGIVAALTPQSILTVGT